MANIAKFGFIMPNTVENVVVESKYVKGTFTVADSLDDLKALIEGSSQKSFINGSLAYVPNDKKYYQFNGTSWTDAKLGGDEIEILTDYDESGKAIKKKFNFRFSDVEPEDEKDYIVFSVDHPVWEEL